MEVTGTPSVAIKVPGIDGYFTMPDSLEILVSWTRDSAIPELGPFTRPD